MVWWLWALFGLVLLILEVQAFGGFYLMFFGVGALFVSLLAAVAMVETDWIQWLLFSVFSVVALILFRQPIVRKLTSSAAHKVDSLVGETAVASEDIPSGGIGKAEMRGTAWNAHNAGTATLRKDARCRVERIDGLTLWVRAE